MIRGTTPTHYFTLPFDTDQIDKLRITYSQKDVPVLELTEADVTKDGQEIRYKLTQEDTLKFKNGIHTELQIRVRTKDGTVLASNVMVIAVSKILNEDVL